MLRQWKKWNKECRRWDSFWGKNSWTESDFAGAVL